MMDNEDKLERLQKVMEELPDVDRRLLMYDIQNAYEDRNELLKTAYGIVKKRNREYYIKALKTKVKQMVEGTYKERKSKFDKLRK